MGNEAPHRALARLLRAGAGRTDGGRAKDQLTGLANRRGLTLHLQRAIGRSGNFSVFYIDLDDFKLVNDTLGHAAGDELLLHVSRAMAVIAGPNDLVARQGGDEFVFVALGAGAAEALAAELLAAITRPVSLRGIEISVGASIGIANWPADGHDAAALLESADAAMYEAKRTGRNQIRSAHPAQARERDRERDRATLGLTASLPDAIRRDELVLYWQPLVDVDDLSVIGLEALVRWNHPEHGLCLPAMFLPFARQTGLISAIDEWVAGAVARQRHAWHAHGLDPYVGFNLDPQYGRRPGALESLLERMDAGALDMAHLTIELSESVSLRDDDELLAFVWGLHAAGVTLSLDEFGRAYSSLNRLRELPTRWVKLDRMFLKGVPEDPMAANVLEAAIDLMRALQLEFIVEGVEHEEQRRFLRSLGVRVAQGYLLGRPVPAEDLDDRLRRSAPSRLVTDGRQAA